MVCVQGNLTTAILALSSPKESVPTAGVTNNNNNNNNNNGGTITNNNNNGQVRPLTAASFLPLPYLRSLTSVSPPVLVSILLLSPICESSVSSLTRSYTSFQNLTGNQASSVVRSDLVEEVLR